MATATRPYIVTDSQGKKRLIQAPNQAQARNWVARNQYDVKVANANEVIELMSQGVVAEIAAEDDAKPEPEPVVDKKTIPFPFEPEAQQA